MKRFLKWFSLVVLGMAVLLALFFVFHRQQAKKSPQWVYAQRSLARKTQNYDMRNAIDLSAGERWDYTGGSWLPLACINTASSCYNDKRHAANCERFRSNPSRWQFCEVSRQEAVPGDMIICFNHGHAYHAVIYIQNSLLGPLVSSTMPNGGYWHYIPANMVFLMPGQDLKYYRYYGDDSK